ncbi:hypothetical protein [Rhizobium helianthi]
MASPLSAAHAANGVETHNVAFCLKTDSKIDLTPLGKNEVGVVITKVGASATNVKGNVVVSANNRHGKGDLGAFWKSGMTEKLPLAGGSCYNLSIMTRAAGAKEWSCVAIDPNINGSAMTFSGGVISGFIVGVSDVNTAAPVLHCPPKEA